MTIHPTTISPSITAAEQRYLDLYTKVAERLPGARSGEVRAWREAALQRFVAQGLPHRRIEEWKYTDLRALMPEVHPLSGLLPAVAADVDVEAAIGEKLAGLDSYRAVFVDGLFRPDLSTVQEAPGVTFATLRSLLEDEAQIHERLLPVERDVIADLTTAFATDGTILSVAAATRLEKPVHLIFLNPGSSARLAATHNSIRVGEGAALSLIESHSASGDTQAFSLIRLAIEANASLNHTRLNFGGAKYLSSAVASLGAGAHYEPSQIAIGPVLVRAQARIRFDGEGARCHYAGAMLLRGHAHTDFTLVVDHAAPGCESRELVKAVLDGRSRGVFQGKVIVQRDAQKTDGKQMANALLLSDEAEFDSKPELEIFADDVVCGHGATAGQLDEDMLFYLRARGIPEMEARALLIAAFAAEAFDSIENEDLRSALVDKVDAWLVSRPE